LIDATTSLTPSSLGIAGFDAFRPAQVAALERIAASEARVVMVQAPTGSGKSLIARAAGAVLGMSATYCSTTSACCGAGCSPRPNLLISIGFGT
jgi:sigma54-dependent transcription regulator